MGLFSKKPSVWSFSLPQSEEFEPSKRIKVTTYQDKEAEAGIKKVLKRSTIKEIRFDAIPDHAGMKVFADGNKVGTLWRDYYQGLYDRIKKEKISRARLVIDGDVYLFID